MRKYVEAKVSTFHVSGKYFSKKIYRFENKFYQK